MSNRYTTQSQQQLGTSGTAMKGEQNDSWNINHSQPAPQEEALQMESLDEELGNYFRERSTVVENDETQKLKLSQLRQLLEKNLQPTISPTMNVVSTNSAFKPAIKPEPPVVGSWSPYNVTSGSAPGQPPSSG